jgi:hypothetical protein
MTTAGAGPGRRSPRPGPRTTLAPGPEAAGGAVLVGKDGAHGVGARGGAQKVLFGAPGEQEWRAVGW